MTRHQLCDARRSRLARAVSYSEIGRFSWNPDVGIAWNGYCRTPWCTQTIRIAVPTCVVETFTMWLCTLCGSMPCLCANQRLHVKTTRLTTATAYTKMSLLVIHHQFYDKPASHQRGLQCTNDCCWMCQQSNKVHSVYHGRWLVVGCISCAIFLYTYCSVLWCSWWNH